jgi:hypothetical protein
MHLRKQFLIAASAICVLAPAAALARPNLSIGIGAAVEPDLFCESVYDTLGNELLYISYADPWAGPIVELEYGPVWAFRFRTELARFRFFFAGGSALDIPGIGLDILAEPPFAWRVKPYIWAGGRWTGYFGDQGRFDEKTDHNLHAGLGCRWAVTSRLALAGEVRLLSDDMYGGPAIVFPDLFEFGHARLSGVGISRVSIGARLAVGT